MPSSPEEAQRMFGEMAEAGAPVGRFSLSQLIGAGLPAAGMAAGTAIGGPVGGFLGEMAGSYAGRRANVALGLEEPGTGGDVASVAVPAGLRAAAPVVKGIVKRLPGVGTAMQDVAFERAQAIPGRFKPAVASDTLYAQVTQHNPMVALPETGKTAGDLLAKEATLHKNMQSSLITDQAEALADIAAQGTDFQTLWLTQKRVRSLMQSAKGEEHNALGQLDAAIWRDLERMANQQGSPAAGLLRAANRAYRKERANETLTDIISRSSLESVQGQGSGRANAGAMLKAFDDKVRHDELFAGAFSANERTEIRGILKDLSQIPVMGPVAGQAFGSGMGVGMGGLTFAASGDPAVSGLMAAMPWMLGMALGSAPGRAMVKGLMERQQLMTPAGHAAVRGFLRTTGQLTTEAP
jgi:hypothetical protein